MSTSQRTFDQVKNILGKLDRNIDAARAKRTQVRPATAPTPSVAPVMTGTSGMNANTLIGGPSTTAAPVVTPSPALIGQGHTGPTQRSIYGRAQPMRPSNGTNGR
jgi:hypothetical protein